MRVLEEGPVRVGLAAAAGRPTLVQTSLTTPTASADPSVVIAVASQAVAADGQLTHRRLQAKQLIEVDQALDGAPGTVGLAGAGPKASLAAPYRLIEFCD